jgi:hypothetical protein
MPATVPCGSMGSCAGVMGRLSHWNDRRIPQIRREHQHERRDDSKRKERVQRRQNPAEVSARIDR